MHMQMHTNALNKIQRCLPYHNWLSAATLPKQLIKPDLI